MYMYMYVDTSVCLEVSISIVIPESLDICPQLHLKQISQSSGITLLIHTPPDTHWSRTRYPLPDMRPRYPVCTVHGSQPLV